MTKLGPHSTVPSKGVLRQAATIVLSDCGQVSGGPSWCVFRKSVTGGFGIVTSDFGNVTGGFGAVSEGF